LQQFMTANQAVAKQATPGVESQVTPPAQASTEAAQAWWNMLTQQFGQIAAATSASMGASQSADSVSRTTPKTPGAKDDPAPTKKTRARAAPKKST